VLAELGCLGLVGLGLLSWGQDRKKTAYDSCRQKKMKKIDCQYKF
jgi:hypothetical protein